MTLSFDPDSLSLPIGHFMGGSLIPAPGVIPMHRPSDAKAYADCPIADADLVDRAVETAKAALKASNWGGVRPRERTPPQLLAFSAALAVSTARSTRSASAIGQSA